MQFATAAVARPACMRRDLECIKGDLCSAAMPVSDRIGTGAHCISRCGNRTNSTPPARPKAASLWQQRTVTPGGARGSGASLEVNVRSW